MATDVFPATEAARCRALLISAPASGQGKTTVTAALARAWGRQGLRVRVFKTGPDFIDPMVHARASGAPCHQLDLWMGGEAHCRELLWRAAQDHDVILVEGVMGLHDGQSSSADLAVRFGLPVMVVIDAAAMAQTFGALALGLRSYRPGLPFAGVLANRVGSPGHADMLRESLPEGMTWFGALPRDDTIALPSRHLGLVQADELQDLDQRLDRAADRLVAMALPLPPPVCFLPPAPQDREPDPGRPLAGVCVAVARDAAFSFVYPANLELLERMGAELVFFSPLADEPVPEAARSLYLPGGYPELHLEALGRPGRTRASVRAHHAAGRPIVAECGGLLALAERLTDADGHHAPLWGLMPGDALMTRRLVNLGMHSADLPEGTLRGHTFHHGRFDSPLAPVGHTRALRHQGRPEALWRRGRLHASFLHLYFPSNPQAAAALFRPDPA
ncbi:cobyrinic acid a,c-diamide synthase [Sphaerotilus hippei]|uniref:Cobyrinate a,c-diamide synthase n=1 Tax=Sphaerotilus hippei TaxID=744406 RepID=A0A318GWQ4_9BURK|nr:cobyrinate a,c-diamide synthase [Sphaerotilus hippei]PXW94000.1 cobyrinic acid a,c-diamide synthase [Sphaerotilus hippei]